MESNTGNAAVAALPQPDDGAPGYRVPPANLEAEQALLGAILVNNRAYEQVSEFLRSDHFSDQLHGRIYEAIGKQIERALEANPTTLQFYFEQDEALKGLGGHNYLGRLAASAVTVINARDYGQTVHDLFLRRQLIDLGEDTVNEAYDPDVDNEATSQIERAEQRLYDLATVGDYQGGFRDFPSVLTEAIQTAEAAYKRDGKLTGVGTGLTDMDNLLGGLHRSDLIILAGRPSMGKTALATNIAYHAANAYKTETDEFGNETVVDGGIVAFFSLEMSAEQLATRILSEKSGVGSELIRRGQMNNAEFGKLVEATHELQRAKIYIDDTPALSVSALRTRARRLKRQHGLGLIVVDYLQLVSGSSTRSDNRVQEVSEITRGLKTLAKELDVPVVALSQLSRQVEQRDDKRPQLSDLRESGSIEQDADVVMFIFREEYYVSRREPREDTPEHHAWQEEMDQVHNLAEVIVAKQRHGPTGKVLLHFNGMLTKFGNLSRQDYMPEDNFS
ncbi:MAG: replicative DNA helicase [Rhodospirillaceae bacterium]|jgi:replicative DNA helicase|nr:replicative DNA helicase [Rhodospirillaceae bacterium]MBT5459424.1 replicative DNA helicase [Rhodospirillaceae bacterium]